MSYEEILKELDKVNLKDKFILKFEACINTDLLEMIRQTDKINSTGSLIRSLMIFLENESEEWVHWQKVLIYFMTPDFAKIKNF